MRRIIAKAPLPSSTVLQCSNGLGPQVSKPNRPNGLYQRISSPDTVSSNHSNHHSLTILHHSAHTSTWHGAVGAVRNSGEVVCRRFVAEERHQVPIVVLL